MLQPSAELAELTRRVYRALTTGDHETLMHLTSQHDATLLIGTDPDEWWEGHDLISAVWRKQLDEILADAGQFVWTDGKLHAWYDGSLGYVIDNPTVAMPTGDTVAMRCTIVYQLERAQWKIVHWHVSLGVANEEAVGKELTTTFDILAATVEDERPSVTQSTAPDGTVTLLFSDIEGSTQILAGLGDRRYMELLQWHNGVVRTALAENSGQEVSYQGDGFMLAFPSARRALRCALTIQDRVAAERPEAFPAIKVRMGLHTGEALRDRDDFYGHVVHYAARVAGTAHGGQVLASTVVRQLLAGDDEFQFDNGQPAEFKGFDGQQTVYAVTRAHPSPVVL